MKKIIQNAAVLLLLAVLNSQFSTAHAQGTAFTYQGQLQSTGAPANGLFNLRFAIYNSPTNTAGLVAGPRFLRQIRSPTVPRGAVGWQGRQG